MPSYFIITQVEMETDDEAVLDDMRNLLERTGQYMVNSVDVRILSEDDKTFPIVDSVWKGWLEGSPDRQPGPRISYNARRPAYPPNLPSLRTLQKWFTAPEPEPPNRPPSIVDKWFPTPAEEPQSPKSEPELRTCTWCGGGILHISRAGVWQWVHMNGTPVCPQHLPRRSNLER